MEVVELINCGLGILAVSRYIGSISQPSRKLRKLGESTEGNRREEKMRELEDGKHEVHFLLQNDIFYMSFLSCRCHWIVYSQCYFICGYMLRILKAHS